MYQEGMRAVIDHLTDGHGRTSNLTTKQIAKERSDRNQHKSSSATSLEKNTNTCTQNVDIPLEIKCISKTLSCSLFRDPQVTEADMRSIHKKLVRFCFVFVFYVDIHLNTCCLSKKREPTPR